MASAADADPISELVNIFDQIDISASNEKEIFGETSIEITKPQKKKHATIYFNGDKLAHFEGDGVDEQFALDLASYKLTSEEIKSYLQTKLIEVRVKHCSIVLDLLLNGYRNFFRSVQFIEVFTKIEPSYGLAKILSFFVQTNKSKIEYNISVTSAGSRVPSAKALCNYKIILELFRKGIVFSPPLFRATGLPNKSGTCYMISALVPFLMLPAFSSRVVLFENLLTNNPDKNDTSRLPFVSAESHILSKLKNVILSYFFYTMSSPKRFPQADDNEISKKLNNACNQLLISIGHLNTFYRTAGGFSTLAVSNIFSYIEKEFIKSQKAHNPLSSLCQFELNCNFFCSNENCKDFNGRVQKIKSYMLRIPHFVPNRQAIFIEDDPMENLKMPLCISTTIQGYLERLDMAIKFHSKCKKCKSKAKQVADSKWVTLPTYLFFGVDELNFNVPEAPLLKCSERLTIDNRNYTLIVKSIHFYCPEFREVDGVETQIFRIHREDCQEAVKKAQKRIPKSDLKFYIDSLKDLSKDSGFEKIWIEGEDCEPIYAHPDLMDANLIPRKGSNHVFTIFRKSADEDWTVFDNHNHTTPLKHKEIYQQFIGKYGCNLPEEKDYIVDMTRCAYLLYKSDDAPAIDEYEDYDSILRSRM